MIDEMALRKDLTYLEVLLYELEDFKHISGRRPDTRTMVTTPGPQSPGNGQAINLDGELKPQIRAWCFTFWDTIDDPKPIPARELPTFALVEWLLMYPYYVATNFDAEAFTDELGQWIRRVEKTVGRDQDTAEIARRPEIRHDAAHIVRRMSTRGWVINKDQVRKWAERGHITRVDRPDGKGGYLLTEVIKYLSSREAESGLPKTL
ncbi:hypothetical protein [Corynebacterium glutamicum]|uniref:Uncharacterized protein n=2 Tax=Corynebacterium glutamicum TaxID=1718 RepID=Q5KRF3_CORGT|nr:hypothetical protein [Corynebacterium glutamicum]BAD84101.1 hypothetical protein [Corynebacterium glutamicum]BAF54893.1 hypothetical protein cgR_1898 [Corynebacterium glutamicum R]